MVRLIDRGWTGGDGQPLPIVPDVMRTTRVEEGSSRGEKAGPTQFEMCRKINNSKQSLICSNGW